MKDSKLPSGTENEKMGKVQIPVTGIESEVRARVSHYLYDGVSPYLWGPIELALYNVESSMASAISGALARLYTRSRIERKKNEQHNVHSEV